MREQDDRSLIIKAQQGDDAAFEELLRRYYDRIFAMACSWCLNRDRAQDITQTVCFAIAKNIRGYRHDAAFLTWAYRITINTAKNMAAGDRRRRENEQAYAQENAAAQAPSPHEILENREVLGLIHTLPDSLKQAVLLVHYEGLNHKQAAQILGCAEMTVSWRVHKARKLLGEKIA
jgi:RNA polymerase sigma-70 factor, ECF subfamily